MNENQHQIHPIDFENLQTAVLPLIAIAQDGRWHPLGTAFVVSVPEPKKALLLTAAHTIKHALTIDASHSRQHSTTPIFFQPNPPKSVGLKRTYVHALLRHNGVTILTDMVKAWLYKELDVAAIIVEIKPDIDVVFPSRLMLDTRPINLGTPVMAVGYPGLKADFSEPPDYDANNFKVKIELCLEYRTGKVTRICLEREGIHDWPGFLVDFPFDSGMSGGPVIDLSAENPRVRGLIGGDLSEDPQHITCGSGAHAFASMIWPAMLIKTQIKLFKDGLELATDVRLLDLARYGIIDDRGRAHNHIGFAEHSTGIKYWWNPEASSP